MQLSRAAPSVVYLALNDWFSSARLPRHLSRAGFRLIAICTQASPLRQVRHFELTRPSLQDIFVRIAGPEAEADHHA